LNFVDAGILNNVATEVVLRPQRTPDLLIVMDFNAYESDEKYDYKVRLQTAIKLQLHNNKFCII